MPLSDASSLASRMEVPRRSLPVDLLFRVSATCNHCCDTTNRKRFHSHWLQHAKREGRNKHSCVFWLVCLDFGRVSPLWLLTAMILVQALWHSFGAYLAAVTPQEDQLILIPIVLLVLVICAAADPASPLCTTGRFPTRSMQLACNAASCKRLEYRNHSRK